MLRHPVVLTSLEEDFKRIGLIGEDKAAAEEAAPVEEGLPTSQGGEAGSGKQGHKPNNAGDGSKFAAKGSTKSSSESQKGSAGLPGIPYTVGGDRLNPQSGSRKDANIDYAEAVEFSEDFDQFWESNGHRETIELTDEEMEELEGMGEGFTLDASWLDEAGDETEPEEPESEADASQEESAESHLNSVYESLQALQAGEALESREAALPGFANIALIAEKLADTFGEAGQVLEDAEYTEMAGGFAEMAEYSAQVVAFLESEEDVDFDAVNSTFAEFTETLMSGVQAFAALTEDDGEEEPEAEPSEDEQEEGKMPAAFMKKMKGKFGKDKGKDKGDEGED